MTTVRELNDPRSLDALAPRWQELLEATPGASFFQSLDWLQVYWKHFGAGKRLRVLVVSEDDQVQGILPLVVRRSRRFEPFRVLTYPLDGWGNFFGPLGAEPWAVLAAGLRHVRETKRDWHFLELDWVDERAGEETASALATSRFPAVQCTRMTNAMVDLSGFETWNDYAASQSSKWRGNLRQSEKKLASRGKVTYARYRGDVRGADPRWDLYATCETISRASWQHSSRQGTMLTKGSTRDFYRDSHETAADFGAVDINLLYVDGRPAAFTYGYHWQGCVIGLKTAFDPAVSQEGAGRVIQARQIADSLARGDRLYELGELVPWKQTWATELRVSNCYTHFPLRLPAQLVRAKRALQERLARHRHPPELTAQPKAQQESHAHAVG
jgi:CelD/BcsL family acetyltransferase involved in cellulose biosynthesis